MPKHKIARKSTTIDMTAMCDVAFLLLTFFILTAKMRQQEIAETSPPSSISEKKAPEEDVLKLFVDAEGRVYMELVNQNYRRQLIERVNEGWGLALNEEQLKTFELNPGFGLPKANLKQYLDLGMQERELYQRQFKGIPNDTTANELGDWVLNARFAAREVNEKANLRIIVKADANCEYPAIARLFQTLEDQEINKFVLITTEEDGGAKAEE